MCTRWRMIARTFSSWPTCWRIVGPSRSSTSSLRAVSQGVSPRASADSRTVRPTYGESTGSVTPEISMVSHSMGTPWQPSEPTTSMWWRMRSAVPSSASRASTASGPPSPAQLGSIATSVVQPGV